MNRNVSAAQRALSLALSLAVMGTSLPPVFAEGTRDVLIKTGVNAGAMNSVTLPPPVHIDPLRLNSSLDGLAGAAAEKYDLDTIAPQQLELFTEQELGTKDTALPPSAVVAREINQVSADRDVNNKEGDAKSGAAVSASGELVQAARTEKNAERVFTGGIGFLPTEARTDINLDAVPRLGTKTAGRRLARSTTNLVDLSALGKPSLIRRILRTLGWSKGDQASILLPGNPQDAAGVEAAVRGIIDSHPELFEGLRSEDFKKVLIAEVPGRAGLPDTFVASFRQQLGGIPIDTTYLEFEIRIIDGKSTIFRWNDSLLPELDLNTQGTVTPEESRKKAKERLGRTPESLGDIQETGLEVKYWDNAWRVARVYRTANHAIRLAVDINDPQARVYAWGTKVPVAESKTLRQTAFPFLKNFIRDPKKQLLQLVPAGTYSTPGTASGRGVLDGPQKQGSVLQPLPLGHLKVTTSEGKAFYTDAEGNFTVEASGQEVEVTVTLEGKNAKIKNEAMADLKITAKAKPGDRLQVVFNPEGADEYATADVMVYHWADRTIEWMKKNIADIFPANAITIHTNKSETCNAYFDMSDIWTFAAGDICVNTGYNGVVPHELGHYLDALAHGNTIPDGGLSEAIGDIMLFFMLNTRYLGKDFFTDGRKDNFIRDGENTTPFDSGDEVHRQGEVGGGTAYKFMKAAVAAYGEVQGTALAYALFLPAILMTSVDIPDFIQKVLERDIDKTGNAPHFQMIHDAAAAHGIELKKPVPHAQSSGTSARAFWRSIGSGGGRRQISSPRRGDMAPLSGPTQVSRSISPQHRKHRHPRQPGKISGKADAPKGGTVIVFGRPSVSEEEYIGGQQIRIIDDAFDLLFKKWDSTDWPLIGDTYDTRLNYPWTSKRSLAKKMATLTKELDGRFIWGGADGQLLVGRLLESVAPQLNDAIMEIERTSPNKEVFLSRMADLRKEIKAAIRSSNTDTEAVLAEIEKTIAFSMGKVSVAKS